MHISITTPLEGAGLAFFTYILTLIIALFVAGIVQLMYRLIHRKGKEATPTAEKK